MCTGRRLFFTKNGYVGPGPTEMQPGDSIHILAGGAYPFVLRPVTNVTRRNTFELVRDSYVHGVMDGQAVDGL